MNIVFHDELHGKAFDELLCRMHYKDCYHQSLAYLLTLDSVCREHIDDCFDFDGDLIKIEALAQPWQTGTSKKTTRLAYNLWNGCYDDGEKYTDKDGYTVPLPSQYYAVDEIFCCSYALYYWQAIQLRYPEYTASAEEVMFRC